MRRGLLSVDIRLRRVLVISTRSVLDGFHKCFRAKKHYNLRMIWNFVHIYQGWIMIKRPIPTVWLKVLASYKSVLFLELIYSIHAV